MKCGFIFILIVFLTGCAHKPHPNSDKILELPNESASEGCKFIKKSNVLNMYGFGHDMHVENAKILMINDVIANGGNAYVQHYLSANFGEAGNAKFSIYNCPDGYNSSSKKAILENHDLKNNYSDKLKELKNMFEQGLITKDEYDKKRKEIVNSF